MLYYTKTNFHKTKLLNLRIYYNKFFLSCIVKTAIYIGNTRVIVKKLSEYFNTLENRHISVQPITAYQVKLYVYCVKITTKHVSRARLCIITHARYLSVHTNPSASHTMGLLWRLRSVNVLSSSSDIVISALILFSLSILSATNCTQTRIHRMFCNCETLW